MADLRIVSLLSSATEIIYRLGLKDRLFARSHECDYPPEVLKLPFVTSPKFPTDGTSYEIDARVKAIVAEGLSVYRVDGEKLFGFRPTHILTQTQCHVCAVSLSDVENAVKLCSPNLSAEIVHLEAADFEGVLLDIRKLARSLGVDLAGEKLIREMKDRLQSLQMRTSSLAPKKVFLIEWLDPLISAGHWTAELIEFAGGEIVLGEKGKLSPVISWQAAIDADPDIVVIAPCGFGLQKTKEEFSLSLKTAPWKKLKAFQKNQVYLSDGNQFFNRAGPRLVETAEILAEAIHGLDFGYRKSGLLTQI